MNKSLKKSTTKSRTPSKPKQKAEKPKANNRISISETNTTTPATATTTVTENKVKSPKPKPPTPPITNPSTSRQTSILLPNLVENVEPETKTRNIQYKQTSVLSQEEKEINEALQAIVQSRGGSPIAKHVTNPKTGKSLVKIITPSQGKSLIIPSSGAQLLKQTQETKSPSAKTQIITQQLLQTLNAQQKLLPKTSETETKKVPAAVQQQILKNVTLLRSVPQPQANSPTTASIIIDDDDDDPPAQLQQEQVAHALKQKAIVHQQQQQVIVKQKPVQKQTSLLGQQQVTVGGKTVMTSGQAPMVAKVLTNAAGQVISVGSLLAQHQKQHGGLQQGRWRLKNYCRD